MMSYHGLLPEDCLLESVILLSNHTQTLDVIFLMVVIMRPKRLFKRL